MNSTIPSIPLTNATSLPALGLGTWRLNGAECRRIVREALDFGYTHFDTATLYENEAEIGKALQGVDRSRLFLTSKVWYDKLHRRDVFKECDASLRLLDTDYLDLYLIHWPNKNIPMEETLDAMAELQCAGKVRHIGVSNFTIHHLEQALPLTSAPIAINQVEFHPYLHQKELLEYCEQHNIVLTAYAPLARRQALGDAAILGAAQHHDKTPAQIVLRWLVQKGIVVIPKASDSIHLKANMDIFEWTLKPGEMEQIDALPVRRRICDYAWSEFDE